ncbi:ExbD/TolR family protein [Thiomicrorhabdus arctica]|jgi:biopolymer transport protein ExbD|uniref:ExbD/TolR family protein n=1 Tax=Thiomicrorhabdus arctica TaxID=131540 RepID=UPI0003661798|nr:biopolymer transporter ExbD [Thiomicrorhabdus arctica]
MNHREMPRFDAINVIPLIDVILVLLAIVLTTASFIVKDNLKIELPQTTSTQSYVPSEDQTPIHFDIDKDNQLFLDEQLQTLQFTEQFLTTLTKEQTIIIQVDKKAEFGTFVGLIDALKAHQLNNLTILTQSKPVKK